MLKFHMAGCNYTTTLSLSTTEVMSHSKTILNLSPLVLKCLTPNYINIYTQPIW